METQNVNTRDSTGVGEHEACPARCDVSVGSSEDEQTPKSIQTSPVHEGTTCDHEEVSWRGANGTHWKWTCKKCGKMEVIPKSKSEAPSRPDPSRSSQSGSSSSAAIKARHTRLSDEHRIADKMIQTPLTCHRRAGELKFQVLKHEHGAFDHVSSFQDRVEILK